MKSKEKTYISAARKFSVFLFLFFASGVLYANPGRNPLLTEDAIYLSSSGIHRIDNVTLRPLWSALAGSNTFNPVITSKLLLIGSTSGLHAIEEETGEIRWSISTDDTVYTPTVHDDIAYTGSLNGMLMAIDTKNGDTIWKRKFDGWIYTPVIFSDFILIGGKSHKIYGVDKQDGHIIWEKELSQELVSHPIGTGNGTAIVTTFSSEIIKLDITNGEIIWIIEDRAPVLSYMQIRDSLYVSNMSGYLKRIDLGNGNLMWEHKIGNKVNITGASFDNIIFTSADSTSLFGIDMKNGRITINLSFDNPIIGSPVINREHLILFHNSGMTRSFTAARIPLTGFISLRP